MLSVPYIDDNAPWHRAIHKMNVVLLVSRKPITTTHDVLAGFDFNFCQVITAAIAM